MSKKGFGRNVDLSCKALYCNDSLILDESCAINCRALKVQEDATMCSNVFVQNDFNVTGDSVFTGNVVIEGQLTASNVGGGGDSDLGPITGFVAFWWITPFNVYKTEWGRFNSETGLLKGGPIPYSPSESREQGAPGKVQFATGNGPNELVYALVGENSGEHYMVRHNTAMGTFMKTTLGSNPPDHEAPEIIAYDKVNARYIGMAPISTQSFRYGVVIINESTGMISPLTGAAGAVPPHAQQVLDMEVIGNRIYVFDRVDANEGRINYYDRDTGQYLGFSTFAGSIVPYPGTFQPTWIQAPFTRLWIQSTAYDVQNSRLHVVLGSGGGSTDRVFAWIDANTESELMTKLETGAYDFNLTQYQPAQVINGAAWIDAP